MPSTSRVVRGALWLGIVLALTIGVVMPRRGPGSDDRVRDVLTEIPQAPESRWMPTLTPSQERWRFGLVAVVAAWAVVLLLRQRRA
jgi:hypothetical protein